MTDRTPRDEETRDKKKAADTWRPTSILPVPKDEPGYTFRWIRTSTLGQADAKNVSTRFRERWEPVKASDYPDLEVMEDPNARFEGSIEIGGLMLCKTSTENVERRNEYFAQRNTAQMDAVDNNYMRNEDRRMPLHKASNSRTTRGSGGS